jgi:hypothetical protein
VIDVFLVFEQPLSFTGTSGSVVYFSLPNVINSKYIQQRENGEMQKIMLLNVFSITGGFTVKAAEIKLYN